MEPIKRIDGTVAPLVRENVDTDQIIPAVWMKRVERTGFEDGLFENLRKSPDFVLNQSQYKAASILLSGANFGCGSSREHAPWALRDYGFKAVMAESFADIFRGNLANVGLVPAQVSRSFIREVQQVVAQNPATRVVIDLENRQVKLPDKGISTELVLDESARDRLINGRDVIDETLAHMDEIVGFESRRPSWMPQVTPRKA